MSLFYKYTTTVCPLFSRGMMRQAQKVAQGMSSAVAEIQKDLQKEHRSRGGDGGSFYEFDEAEVGVIPPAPPAC